MSGMMRSEEMSYLQLLVPVEAAQSFVNELGYSGCMQFADLNEGAQAFHRRYMRDIVRISDIERKVKIIEGFLKEHEIAYDDYIPDNMIQKKPVHRDIVDTLENDIGEIYKGLTGDIKVEEELTRDLQRAEDFEEVLRQTSHFLSHQHVAERALQEEKRDRDSIDPDANDVPLLNFESQVRDRDDAKGGSVAFKYFAGVVTDVQRPSFERQVYLSARGNTYSLFNDIPGKQKSTFIIFFLGQHLSEKLDRLCKFMGVDVYLTSANAKDIDGQLQECKQHQADVSNLLDETKRGLYRNMYKVSDSLIDWKLTLMQQKTVFETLNRFKDSERANILIAEGWCPSTEKVLVQQALEDATQGNGNSPHVLSEIHWQGRKGKPPTHFPSNKFTSTFQLIVDTYGVPRYGEVNPAIFTIITFPFLFAVMYGDVFHGSVLFVFSLFLIYKEKELGMKRLGEFLGACYVGRYVLLLMGLFAIYCGAIYNDMASLPLHWFKSGWIYDGIELKNGDLSNIDDGTGVTFDNGFVQSEDGTFGVIQTPHVYPFGLDYAWKGTPQELSFFNGFKMKGAVLLGVSQMMFGLFLSLANHIHFKDQISIWFEFVPQLIFICCTFGYMCFLILYKWWVNWACRFGDDALVAPNIIGVMIDFVLSPAALADTAKIFPSKDFQIALELILLILAVVSIPWMLLPKPILLARKYAKQEEIAKRNQKLSGARGTQMVNIAAAGDDGGKVTAGTRRPENGHDDEDSLNGDKAEKQHLYSTSSASDEEKDDDGLAQELSAKKQASHDDDDEDHHTFGELMIHQIIHTIEYVLGTISNTASYLRLWALSLAHAELSDVIFEQILLRFFEMAPGTTQALLIFVGATAFYFVTFGVLLTMDVLECFLHALRLHWVEWQNKFYQADGIPFTPFSYKAVLAEERGG